MDKKGNQASATIRKLLQQVPEFAKEAGAENVEVSLVMHGQDFRFTAARDLDETVYDPEPEPETEPKKKSRPKTKTKA